MALEDQTTETQDTTTEQSTEQSTLDVLNDALDGDQTQQDETTDEQHTEQTPEQIAEAEAAKKAAEDAEKAAKADPTKMPDGLAPEAQKRFQHLVGELKTERQARETAEAKAQEHEQTVTGLRQLMEETRTSAEDFGMLLEYNRLVKSGSLEQALHVLDEQRRMISLALGKAVPGADALSDFPDLAQEVQGGTLSEARAMEIARARVAQRNAQSATQRTQAQQQAEQQRNQAIESGAKAVDQWAQQMAASDIDWPAKEKMLDAHIEWLGQNVHPAKWLASVQHFYKNLTVPANTNAGTGKGAETPRPLSSGNGPSGARPAPQSALEALEQTLGVA